MVGPRYKSNIMGIAPCDWASDAAGRSDGDRLSVLERDLLAFCLWVGSDGLPGDLTAAEMVEAVRDEMVLRGLWRGEV